jgi:hypothetical protein
MTSGREKPDVCWLDVYWADVYWADVYWALPLNISCNNRSASSCVSTTRTCDALFAHAASIRPSSGRSNTRL